MKLGDMLRWHRRLCDRCTRRYACPEYREIVTDYVTPRQRRAGSTAPHTILSVREGTAT